MTHAATLDDSAAAAEIRAIADACVKCGLCIERCPSYRVLQREQDSPRGRIALADALARGLLPAGDPTALAALDRCLDCGTCTRVCPADVDYGRLIDLARATFPMPAPASRTAARWLTRHRGALRALRPVARAVARGPLRDAFDAVAPTAAMLDSLAGAVDERPAPAFTPGRAPRRDSVALFRGCVAGSLDADTQRAAIEVLARLGHDVHVPAANHCCGALDRHHGHAREATARATDTQARYAALPATHVLGTASGCHAQLRDHVLTDTVIAFDDLFAFLDRDELLPTLPHQPLPMRVALHLPCTQRDVAGTDAALRRVLARIPGLEIASLPEQPACCGAAGTYFADHPRIANALRAERVAQVEATRTTQLLTTNIGCRLHLAAGLANTGTDVRVMHPITLLAQSLRESAA